MGRKIRIQLQKSFKGGMSEEEIQEAEDKLNNTLDTEVKPVLVQLTTEVVEDSIDSEHISVDDDFVPEGMEEKEMSDEEYYEPEDEEEPEEYDSDFDDDSNEDEDEEIE